MNVARLHVIYSLLLAHCFTLAPEDEKAIDKAWQCAIVGDDQIRWPEKPVHEMTITELQQPSRPPQPVKICSMPSQLEKLIAAQELSALFDLRGVPGFFCESVQPGPGANTLRAQMIADFGPWRINLPSNLTSGLLAPYYNGGQYILGIRVHRSVRDRNPFVLSSKGLPGGSAAVAYREAA